MMSTGSSSMSMVLSSWGGVGRISANCFNFEPEIKLDGGNFTCIKDMYMYTCYISGTGHIH